MNCQTGILTGVTSAFLSVIFTFLIIGLISLSRKYTDTKESYLSLLEESKELKKTLKSYDFIIKSHTDKAQSSLDAIEDNEEDKEFILRKAKQIKNQILYIQKLKSDLVDKEENNNLQDDDIINTMTVIMTEIDTIEINVDVLLDKANS